MRYWIQGVSKAVTFADMEVTDKGEENEYKLSASDEYKTAFFDGDNRMLWASKDNKHYVIAVVIYVAVDGEEITLTAKECEEMFLGEGKPE